MDNKVRKIFISQPMSNREEADILNERKFLITFAKDILEVDGFTVEIIDSYLGDLYANHEPLWCLGESLKLLSTADGIILGPNWTTSRGCVIEHECAIKYDIPIVYAYNN